MKKIILILAYLGLSINLASANNIVNLSNKDYGPNLSQSIYLNSPLGSQARIPNGYYAFSYSWIDPIKDKSYYSPVKSVDPYWSWRLNLEVSPLYGQIKTELGLRPVPFLEVSLGFRHMQYFGSNVEMGMPASKKSGNLDIEDTWSGDYIYNNIYNEIHADYIQAFDITARLDFVYKSFYWATKALFSYVDISEKFDNKSFDYYYMIPVYSRDFMINVVSNVVVPINPSLWDMFFGIDWVNEGVLLYDEPNKEVLWEFKANGGAVFHIKDRENSHSIIFDVGYLFRNKKFTKNMNINDRVILGLSWQFNHDFKSLLIYKD